MAESGRIELIIGCMWSGKSSEMLRQAKRYKSIGKNILVIKHGSTGDIFMSFNIVKSIKKSNQTEKFFK